MTAELAAIVRHPAVDDVLAYLAAEGHYDARRRIESYDEEAVAIPLTEPVDHPAIDRIEAGVAVERRLKTLDDHLEAAGWSASERRRAPRSYARIGRIIVVTEPVDVRTDDVASALLAMHGEGETVVEQVAIEGESRRPRLRHLGGRRTTRTVHREHGIAYELDLAEVMFSPGNQAERVRMGAVVSPGERVLDMCAGIGYFTLPMAAAGAHVTAVERNPRAVAYLSRNLTHNALTAQVRPVLADCRTVAVRADRVVIGHLPVHDCRADPTGTGENFLDGACRALDGGGWLHVHGIAHAGDHDRAAGLLSERLERRGVAVSDLAVDRVKGIAPRTDHVAIDALIDPGG